MLKNCRVSRTIDLPSAPSNSFRMRTVPSKLIIDADPGIGDALAVALALLDPEVDLLAATATAGCVSGPIATKNLQAVIELIDPPKWPRLGACDAAVPLPGGDLMPGFVDPVLLNGRYGLGESAVAVAELHKPHDAVKLLIELVRQHPQQVTVLTLGPLTNIQAAQERDPEFLSLLREMVCLGGSIAAGGNATAAAEFNIFADPEAARQVLKSPATKTLVPLDAAQQLVLNYDQFARLSDVGIGRAGKAILDWLRFGLRASHEHLGNEGFSLCEVVALAAVAQDRLVHTSSMAIDVETQTGLCRGVTVFDRRASRRWRNNIEVVDDINPQGLLDYFGRMLRRIEI
ncbi:MAG: nucleoside hydrolase [Planctomycetes bacterium]|nr:nucleoside hydrolase [Planctomycetota bacterium]